MVLWGWWWSKGIIWRNINGYSSNRLDETVACWDHINEDRLKEALETEADTLVSACVFCKNNLSLAAKETDSGLAVFDLSQILEDSEFS